MTVGRSIVVKNSRAAVGLFDNVVAGNLIVRGTRAYGIWIERNTVNGYVLDRDNYLTSTKHFVRDNAIGGDLKCFSNRPDPFHVRNTVGGVSLGECAP